MSVFVTNVLTDATSNFDGRCDCGYSPFCHPCLQFGHLSYMHVIQIVFRYYFHRDAIIMIIAYKMHLYCYI